MFYRTQTGAKNGDDGGGLGPLVIPTNRNDRHRYPYKHLILHLVSKSFLRFHHRNFPDTLGRLEWTLRRNLSTTFTKFARAKIIAASILLSDTLPFGRLCGWL
jgi:hypothetical protein